MTKKWVVLFDWDGTLIDSLPVKINNAGRLFEQAFGVPAAAIRQAYRRHSGIPRQQLFAAICRETGLQVLDDEQYLRLSKSFTEVNLAALSDAQADKLLLPDTFPALEALTRLGYPLYVSSSADGKEIRTLAVQLGLERFFTDILGSTPGFGKGAQHVQHILEQQAARLDQLVFVGDEPADVALGQSAGVLTVARVGTYSIGSLAEVKPDYIINTLSELPDILIRLAGTNDGA